MGLGPYEPFDEELLKPLTPHLKVMGSASAGYNEFDVDWMSRNGILFCNSRNAVNEATADMALLLILGVLRDLQARQSCIAKGTWRGKTNGMLLPTRDPSGLTLGIVGMGAIGKVTEPESKTVSKTDKLNPLLARSSQSKGIQYEPHLLPAYQDVCCRRGCARNYSLLYIRRASG